jgi:ClpP class serine protease
MAAAPAPAALPYKLLDNGTAVLTWSGLFVKHPTSFGALFGETSTVEARAALRAADRDPKVRRVVLVIDSPGGMVSGTPELSAAVRSMVKPVDAYVDGLAASAALWAASCAGRIYASESSFVGSIGAYAVVEDTSGAFAQQGIKVHVVSTAPPVKGGGVDGARVEPEVLAAVKSQLDAVVALFVRDIATGRGVSTTQAQAWHTGEIWIASEAKRRGLIDGIADLGEVLAGMGAAPAVPRSIAPAVSKAPAAVVAPRPPAPAPAPPKVSAQAQLEGIAQSLIGPGVDRYAAFAEACRRNPGLEREALAAERESRGGVWGR